MRGGELETAQFIQVCKKRDMPLETCWESLFTGPRHLSARVNKALPLSPREKPVDALSKLRQELSAPEHKLPNRY